MDGMSKEIRKVVKMLHNGKCAFCDEHKHLHIHHLDKNRANNDISNLIPVCAIHHAMLHPNKALKILMWDMERFNRK